MPADLYRCVVRCANSRDMTDLLPVPCVCSAPLIWQQVLNSLLYWLLDLAFKEMRINQAAPRWAPEPFLLRLPGVEGRMVTKLARLGHLLELLASSPSACDAHGPLDPNMATDAPLDGVELLRVVREVETTVLLLNTIRTSCEGRGEGVPRVVEQYMRLITLPSLQLSDMEALQYRALAEMLDLEYEFVASRKAAIAKAFDEWDHPELLFR